MTGIGGQNGSKEIVGVCLELSDYQRCVPSFCGHAALEFGVLKFETGFVDSEEAVEG